MASVLGELKRRNVFKVAAAYAVAACLATRSSRCHSVAGLRASQLDPADISHSHWVGFPGDGSVGVDLRADTRRGQAHGRRAGSARRDSPHWAQARFRDHRLHGRSAPLPGNRQLHLGWTDGGGRCIGGGAAVHRHETWWQSSATPVLSLASDHAHVGEYSNRLPEIEFIAMMGEVKADMAAQLLEVRELEPVPLASR